MIQALHAMLGTKEDKTDISMLYGSRTSDDILGGPALDAWAKQSNGRFRCTHGLKQYTQTHTLSLLLFYSQCVSLYCFFFFQYAKRKKNLHVEYMLHHILLSCAFLHVLTTHMFDNNSHF